MTRHPRRIPAFRILLAVCMVGLTGQIGSAQAGSPTTVTALIQIPKDLELKDEIYEDLNGDGLEDLVLSTGQTTTRYARSLRIHYQRNNGQGFAMEPDQIIPLTPDVIAYACADADPHPGEEILLFTARACFGYRLGTEPKDALFKIADCDFLWQVPDPEHAFSWQRAVLDFDGDNKADVCVPQSNGFVILLRRDTGFVASNKLEIPREPADRHGRGGLARDRSNVSMSADIGNLGHMFGFKPGPEPLLQVNDAVPVPVFTDFNGDRRTDLVIQTSRSLVVWQQGISEPFATKPTRTLKIPKGDTDPNPIDLAGGQYVLDLNQDHRCDFILFARDKTSKTPSTHIMVYLNHETADHEEVLFDQQGTPDQLIKIAGLPGDVQLADINEDGYPDLSFITFRPDLLDQVKTLTSKSLELQFLAFFNSKGHLARRPDITQTLQVFVQEQDPSKQDQGRFFCDYNHDGLLDVLVRDTGKHIGLHLLQKTKDGIQIARNTVWDMTIPEKSQLVIERTKNSKQPVLLIMGRDQIDIVRFQ
jgi:glycosyltransferase involved in cell wall biosynthesis